MEPFNLNKEREEGYFDASGNYVEYLNEKEIKVQVLRQTFSTLSPQFLHFFLILVSVQDAWLDSVDTEQKYTEKSAIKISNEDEIQDLTSDQLGKIKRRIADVLEPGETVSFPASCFLVFFFLGWGGGRGWGLLLITFNG